MIGEKMCFAVVFLGEAMVAWLYFEYLFNRKRAALNLLVSFLTGYTILFAFSLLDNTTVNAICFCITNFVLIKFNYLCSTKSAFLHTLFLCFVMVGAEILVALWIGLYGFEFSAYTYNFQAMVLLAALSKLLYLLFSTIGSRIFAPHKCINEEPRQMLLFYGLPLLSSIIAVTIVYLGMSVGITDIVGIMAVIIIITLLLVNLIFLVLYKELQKANDEYISLQLSIQKEQADIAYYQALQEQIENQRIMAHDIKKHLGTIAALAKQDRAAEIEVYISGLEETFSPFSQARLCAEPILNLLLLQFRDECKAENVLFHCDVRENSNSFLDATSVTSLYGNLLSNALEAASASSAKQIELSVTKNAEQSVMVISVVNSCDNAPIPDGKGGFHTKKTDRRLHGVGLRSIHRIVTKYRGAAIMYFDSDNKQFHHVIQFPEPD